MPDPLPVLNCDDCGLCCTTLVYPPFYRVEDPEWDRLTRERPDLVAGIEADRRQRVAAGQDRDDYERPCLWYDVATRRCKHYDYRPAVCQDFEVGGESCLAYRAEQPTPDGDSDA